MKKPNCETTTVSKYTPGPMRAHWRNALVSFVGSILLFGTLSLATAGNEKLRAAGPVMLDPAKAALHGYTSQAFKAAWGGLSPAGRAWIAHNAPTLQRNLALASERWIGLDAVWTTGVGLAFSGRGNFNLLGGGGSGKSEISDGLLATLLSPSGYIFARQFNPNSTLADVIGGNTRASIDEGRPTRNTEGSIVHADGAKLDELETAGPELKQALFEILNERTVSVGSEVLRVSPKLIVSSGNSTPAEIVSQGLATEGNLGSLRAYLMRYHATAWHEDYGGKTVTQLIMNRGEDRKAGRLFAELWSDVTPVAIEKFGFVDYAVGQQLARMWMHPSEETIGVVRDIAHDMRQKNSAEASDESESVEMTQYGAVNNRSINGYLDAIRYSLFTDILQSPSLGRPEQLEQMMQAPLIIEPISAWRLWNRFAAVMRPTWLEITNEADDPVRIEFNHRTGGDVTGTMRDKQALTAAQASQTFFEQAYKGAMRTAVAAAPNGAGWADLAKSMGVTLDDKLVGATSQGIELRLAREAAEQK